MSSQQQQHAQRHPLPTTLHVVLPHDPGTIFVVSKCAVISTPRQGPRAGRIGSRTVVACRAFAGTGVCELGPRGEANCPFAHVMLDPVQTPRFHAHRAPAGGWPSLAAVPYERFPPTTGTAAAIPDAAAGSTTAPAAAVVFPMQAPNAAGQVVETLRPEECLLTRALEGNTTGTFTHCAHWLLKGSCHYGAACKFVHAALPSELARSTVATRRTRWVGGSRYGGHSGDPATTAMSHPVGASAPRASGPVTAAGGAAYPAPSTPRVGVPPPPRSYPLVHDPYVANPRQRPPQ